MTQFDWKKMLSLSPEDLSEEEKDDLYDIVAWYDVESDIDSSHINILLRIAQEILKYKGEQVESLVLELDDLAARQGREEAQRHQNLIEEVEELRAQLAQPKTHGNQFSKGTEVDDLRQELVKCELQNEQLLSELKAREREILAEKREVEKFAGQVASLEREKADLRRELAVLHDETNEQRASAVAHQESPEVSLEKQQEMAISIRQKNKHISQLLTDVETIEKENLILRDKLSTLRDELSEATKHLTQLTGETTSLRHTCQEQEEKLSLLEEQKAALRNQVQELVQQKLLRDNQLDDFSEALDTRVKEWKRVLEEKDAEIEELQARLSHLAAQAPNIQIDTERSRVALLSQTLQKREDQVETLQQQLAQATKELNDSAAIIEQLKAQKSKHSMTAVVEATAVNKLRTQLQQTEDKVKLLEEKFKDAEEDARLRAEETTEMIIQLREYESGEYGLAEAVSEIKELRQQRRVRDKHIEELVQAANKLEAEAGQLEEQNVALRDKLGLPPEEPVCVDGVLAQRKKDQSLMRLLQQQAERLEEEKVQLKLENRKLLQQLNNLNHKLQLSVGQPETSVDEANQSLVPVNGDLSQSQVLQKRFSFEVSDRESAQVQQLQSEQLRLEQRATLLQEKIDDMTKENDALRIGMHEILDSIHNQDGSSAVQVESQCLERLLEALDSRHVSGWYHPAMRLQAQVHSLEGSNAVLREQLRATRLEENKRCQDLQRAQLMIEQLEHSLSALQDGQNMSKSVISEELSLPLNMPSSSAEVISKLNMHLLHILNEYHKEEEKNKKLAKTLEELSKNFNVVRHQMGLLYKQYGSEKLEWSRTQEDFIAERETLKDSIESLKSKVEEHENHWKMISEGEDEQKLLLADSARRLADIRGSEVVLGRKCKALQNMDNLLRKENTKIKEEMNAMECTVTKRIGDLQRSKEMASYQITALQNKLQDCVPVSALETANRQINEITAKYRDLLQKDQSLDFEVQLTERLQGEVESLNKDKEHLRNELQSAKEKLHSLEVLVTSLNQDTVSQDTHDTQMSLLAKKLATVELKEIHEHQRADHADGMYKILKAQQIQLEERMSELGAQNSELQQRNAELQQVERELRDSVLGSVSREQLQQVQAQLSEVESRKVELQLEKERLQEVGDIAQEQVRCLELWKVSQEYQLESLSQQVLELQATGDDKASIARLSHELLMAQLSEAACNKKVHQLQNEITKLQAHNLRQECKMDEKERMLGQLRSQLHTRCRTLYQVIQELRQQYSGALPLASQEWQVRCLRRLTEERRTASVQLCKALDAAREVASSREGVQLELQALHELKDSLLTVKPQAQGMKQLIEWHNRNTELRLKELKVRRRAEFLEAQYQQAEERLQHQEKHIAMLEEEHMNLDHEREQVQLALEHTQAEFSKHLSEWESERKAAEAIQASPAIVVSDPGTTVTDANLVEQLKQALGLVSNQSQSLLKYEAELAHLRTKVASLEHNIQEKTNLVLAKEQIISEMRLHLSSTQVIAVNNQQTMRDIEITESSDKLALKATVDSLQNILTQKEETIARYQHLLKEGRDEHSKAAARLQEEMHGLHTALGAQRQAYTRLKTRNRQNASDQKQTPSVIEKYLNQLQEQEDEVSELHTTVGNLSNQLQSVRQEVERWKGLAEDRLNNMGELRQRLEEQHQTELQCYRDEAQRYRLEFETAKQDLNLLQEQLKQQMEVTQRAPSVVLQSCVGMLRAQLQEKEAQREALAKTVLHLQNEVKQSSQASVRELSYRSRNSVSEPGTSKQMQDQHKRSSNQDKSLAVELKTARAEIQRLRDLQNRSHRPATREPSQEGRVSAREEQLMKKVKALEEQLQDLKEKHTKEGSEQRVKSVEEVARWDERKKWQQNADKLRQKLKEKTAELEKVKKTNARLRDTVTRLEREKNILDNRLKTGKGLASVENRIETRELETEVTALQTKLEMQQHHAGGLGVAKLTERLEAQQRRIAALELAKKGNSTIAAEMEKLQEHSAVLQKGNLRLESENLELRLELEKFRGDTPRLRQRIQHLENYITLLKADQEQDRASQSAGSTEVTGSENVTKKSTAELQRTIIVLKRIIEKLQMQNRQLQGNKSGAQIERKGSSTDLRAELRTISIEKDQLQERYLEALQKASNLEETLQKVNTYVMALEEKLQEALKSGSDSNKVELLKSQLIHKSQLLEKVKMLLQRAAVKEKALHQQVTALRSLVPASTLQCIIQDVPITNRSELEAV